jgi:hypothetical protein
MQQKLLNAQCIAATLIATQTNFALSWQWQPTCSVHVELHDKKVGLGKVGVRQILTGRVL